MPQHDRSKYFPFYAGDFFGADDVLTWGDSASILYLKCLWRQWLSGSLPRQDCMIAKAVGVDLRKFKRLWPIIESKFPLCDDNLRRNQRLQEIFDGKPVKSPGRVKAAERTNNIRKERDGNRDATVTVTATVEPTVTVGISRGDGDYIAPPPPRLLMALACWDSTRPPNIAHAPKPSPQLVAMFLAVDAPHLEWPEIIAWVFANPFTNGLGKPSKGNTSGYRADFTWMLKPKNLVTATTRVVDPESMTASPQRDRDAAIIAESIRITERTANRKAIQ